MGEARRRADRAARRSREAQEGRQAAAAGRRHARCHQPAEGLLARAEVHEGRSPPLLRAHRAADPAGHRRSAAGDEALSQRRRGPGVLSAPRARGLPEGRARRAGPRRRRADDVRRRRAEDAALHGAAGGDLDGPVVLDRSARWTRPITSRSIWIRSRAPRSRRFSTSRAGCTRSSIASTCPAFPKTSGSEGLHIFIPLPPGTSYEAGVLFCQIVATHRGDQASEGRHHRADGEAAEGPDDLRRLPAEHSRQDARVRLQRARERVCRRVDAARRGTRSTTKISPQDFTIKTIEARVRTGRATCGRPCGRASRPTSPARWKTP